MVNMGKIEDFEVTEKELVDYITRFCILMTEYKNAYEVMAGLFDLALDDEKQFRLLIANAWKTISEGATILNFNDGENNDNIHWN